MRDGHAAFLLGVLGLFVTADLIHFIPAILLEGPALWIKTRFIGDEVPIVQEYRHWGSALYTLVA